MIIVDLLKIILLFILIKNTISITLDIGKMEKIKEEDIKIDKYNNTFFRNLKILKNYNTYD